ncbi:MAG: peroxidase family protein [Planctomycetota bacterium JB042]
MEFEKTSRILAAWAALAGAGEAQEGPFHPLPETREIDGSGNNLLHVEWGRAPTELRRITSVAYADGVGAPAGVGLRTVRDVSNAVVTQPTSIPNRAGASDYLWQWGQFLDHDITETPILDPPEAFDIRVPVGDPWFDPLGTGTASIPLSRSYYELARGVRQQVNELTAYIDASNVYGSDPVRAAALRTLDGTGRLKTSAGDLLPYNVAGLPNAPSTDPAFFLAGDLRSNEQVGLTAMHTLWVREHNRLADLIAASSGAGAHGGPGGHPANRRKGHGAKLDGEEIYQLARAIVGAEMQAITYGEFLPLLLGPTALAPYQGYRADVDAGIANVFATAGYRLGHSMLSPVLRRLGPDLETIAAGDLSLAAAFFAPSEIEDHGIEPYLRGLAHQRAQEIDRHIVDPLRNFLFGPPGAGGFDLASLNLQRARDHGLPSLNQVRLDLGLPPHERFEELSSDPATRAALASVYGDVDAVEIWVGGLAEDHVPGAMVGSTFHAILTRQFEALRDGDRFWYPNHLPPGLVAWVESQTLADVIRRNTDIGIEIPDDVFRAP